MHSSYWVIVIVSSLEWFICTLRINFVHLCERQAFKHEVKPKFQGMLYVITQLKDVCNSISIIIPVIHNFVIKFSSCIFFQALPEV